MLISSNSGLHSARLNKTRYDMLDAIDFFHDVGFEAFDINFCATIYGVFDTSKIHEPILDGDWKRKIYNIAEKAEKLGLKINTSHLPFFKYSERATLPHYDFYREMVFRSIDAAELLGVKWTVAHMAQDVEVAVDYLSELCEYATLKNVGIAVENTTRPIEPLCEAVDILKSRGYNIGICYDTGHANVAGLSQLESLHTIGDRLKMLHIHDNFGKDQHQAPFCGNIDWADVMRGLADINYTGDFNFEVNASKLPDEVRKEYALYLVGVAKYLLSVYEVYRRDI